MSKSMNQTFKVTALAAALIAVYGPAALAQETGTAIVLPQNTFSVGVGNWTNNRPQQGQYDGMSESGLYGLFDADITKRDESTGTWLGLKARSLGLDDREIKGSWERQGNIGGSIEYSRISRDQPYTYNTGVQGIGTTTLRVPSPSITPGAGANIELGTTRDRTTVNFFKNLGVGLNFNASVRNEDKDGTRPWGRGGAAEFAVEPINSTTRQYETTLSYSRDRLQLSGGYYGTTYDNNAGSMVVTSLTTGANVYNLSLPLSTRSHEVFVNGGYDFSPTTRGTFKTSYSRATQDEALGTFGGTASPLAPKNLDGRLDTTLIEAGLTAKPMPKLAIVANLRYRDFADKTPVQGIVFSGTTPTVYNTPFSYTNKVGKAEGTYSLPKGYSLMGGIEYNQQDRSVPTVGTLWVPFASSLNETTYRTALRKSMSETVNGSLTYSHSDRKSSNYVLPGDPNEDLINPMNIADRTRNKWRAMVDWAPTDKLALQAAVEDAKDDYSGKVGPYGLQDGNFRLYSLDGSYQLSQNWQIHAWYTYDETEANEITQQNNTVTKYNSLKETGNSFGVGVRGKVSEKLKMGWNLESFTSDNKYNQAIAGGALAANMLPTPDIDNKLFKMKMFAQYAVAKNADVRFSAVREQWRTNDWSWNMYPASGVTDFAYGTTTDGTTVNANQKQNSTFVGLQYIYKFD